MHIITKLLFKKSKKEMSSIGELLEITIVSN